MKDAWNRLKSSRLLSSFLYFFGSAEIDITSVAVAYYLLVSFFPILMLIASLLPYWHINIEQLLEVLKNVFPERVYPTVEKMLVSVFTQPSGSWLGISIFSVLYTFTRAMNALQKAFNKSYGVDKHRGVILSHIIGIFLGLAIQVILTFSVTAFTAGDRIIQTLSQNGLINEHWTRLLENRTTPVLFFSMFLGLILVFYLLPNVKIPRFRYILPGTVFVMLVMMSVGRIFRYYLDRYALRLMDFRFVTTVVILILILWFMFLATILIIGAVLNATYQSMEVSYFVTRRGLTIPVHKRIQAYRRSRRLDAELVQNKDKKAKRDSDIDEKTLD